ncbi:Ribosomal protein S18 acetylase RimI [Paractinoplanes atraurantiacus]|uniref:Ribosomal protein S18 acetylase RimI n=1 Tax=Paractinoplanes atraurantiacus TaxID=1036182 RepID=A0A285HX29_9ACTN|nr:Ribosomal protein S18 acetylase RimI [Actinoplanes atraurantiacus]
MRRAEPADVPALAEFQDIPSANLPAFTDWMSAHSRTHLAFVADVNGQVAGAAWLLIAERVPRTTTAPRRHGDIQSVMVREPFRNQGIGTALIAAIQTEARTRSLSHVTVHSGRRAVDFYLRNGFTHHRQLLLWEPRTPSADENLTSTREHR